MLSGGVFKFGTGWLEIYETTSIYFIKQFKIYETTSFDFLKQL